MACCRTRYGFIKSPVKPTIRGDLSSALMRSVDAGGGIEHEHLQDRGRAHQVAEGRPYHLYRRTTRPRRDRASCVPQGDTVRGLSVRFPGAVGKSRIDDVLPGRFESAHQPFLADAAKLRRDGLAPEGAAG